MSVIKCWSNIALVLNLSICRNPRRQSEKREKAFISILARTLAIEVQNGKRATVAR